MEIFNNASGNRGFLREKIQDLTKEEMKKIIGKLRAKEELAASEIEYVKLWIAGDAEYYIKMENNFEDWTGEVERLTSEIKSQATGEMKVFEMARVQAMIRDAIRTLEGGNSFLFTKQRSFG